MSEAEVGMKFVLAAFATWRVTHLLALEDGPADLIVRVRLRLGNSLAGKMMDCFKCLSFWIAAPAAFFIARTALDWLLAWLAISGAACLLERPSADPIAMQPIPEPIQGEPTHVL